MHSNAHPYYAICQFVQNINCQTSDCKYLGAELIEIKGTYAAREMKAQARNFCLVSTESVYTLSYLIIPTWHNIYLCFTLENVEKNKTAAEAEDKGHILWRSKEA